MHVEHLDIAMGEQDHKPLAFLSGEFKARNNDGQYQRGKVSLLSTQ
jgi:hypothetical protein